MLEGGVWMHPDLNRYDLNHACAKHPKMSDEEWERAYHDAWHTYFTPKHMERIMRRNAAVGRSIGNMLLLMGWFGGTMQIEGVHPLEGGFLRRKYRRDRRPGFKIESPLTFYPKYWAQLLWSQIRWGLLFARMAPVYWRIKRDPERRNYMDLALEPVDREHLDELGMIAQTRGGEAALAKARRMDALLHPTAQAAK